MIEEEEVPEDQARAFAASVDAIFRLTSAKNKDGIEQLFYEIGCKITQTHTVVEPKHTVKIDKTKTDKKKGCC